MSGRMGEIKDQRSTSGLHFLLGRLCAHFAHDERCDLSRHRCFQEVCGRVIHRQVVGCHDGSVVDGDAVGGQQSHAIRQSSHDSTSLQTNHLIQVLVVSSIRVLSQLGRNPYVSIASDDDGGAAGKGVEVCLTTLHQVRGDLHRDALRQLAVLETARVQLQTPVVLHLLHLCGYEVALLEVVSHHQLILDALPPQLSSGQIHTAQQQTRVQSRVRVHLPSLLLHVDDASDDNVAHLAVVSRLDGFDGDESVDLLHAARQRRDQLAVARERAVPTHESSRGAHGVAGDHELIGRVVAVARRDQCGCRVARGRRCNLRADGR
ncbi:hypothetical protein PMAYCL1PPCAC_04174 [Pristionchus mayeri]|uniref:Uncharacterized protein n=1 Tax=Pristionchus mayeri TaxID=1317129 RepID=A0AAN5C9M1_9BILA|nr:hypothetical protein PMAYCL1PPCAC_04174 [Pristionchus mayeri]